MLFCTYAYLISYLARRHKQNMYYVPIEEQGVGPGGQRWRMGLHRLQGLQL